MRTVIIIMLVFIGLNIGVLLGLSYQDGKVRDIVHKKKDE